MKNILRFATPLLMLLVALRSDAATLTVNQSQFQSATSLLTGLIREGITNLVYTETNGAGGVSIVNRTARLRVQTNAPSNSAGGSSAGSTTNITELSFALLSLQSSATVINFTTNAQTITLTNSATFTSSALATGRVVSLRLVNTGAAKTVTFPSWKWLGYIPTSISSNKVARIDLMSYGSSDSDVIASFAEELSLGSTVRANAFFHGVFSNGDWVIIPNGANTTNFAPMVKLRDTGNNYSTNTGLYLTPVSGRYLLTANVRFKDSSRPCNVGVTIGTNSSVFTPSIWKWQTLTESAIDEDRNNILITRTTSLAAGSQVGLYAFSGNHNVTNVETEVSIELLEQE